MTSGKPGIDKPKALQVRLSAADHAALLRIAANAKTTMTAIIEGWIRKESK